MVLTTAPLRRYLKRFGNKTTVKSDIKAGLVLGIESVPDGLAAGLLAGVNPLHGLYGYLVGTVGGALATGSAFMTVQATGAMSVVISDIPQTQDAEQSAAALATLALLTGLIMLGLGLAKLGSLVRFIPTAVLVGFINAVAINIILGQFDNLTGYSSDGDNRLVKTVDTFTHLLELNAQSLIVGGVTIALILMLEKTRLGALSMVVAVVAGSVAAALLGLLPWGSTVALLGDVATVPTSLPDLELPSISMIPVLIIPALSLALVGLVQGSAISGSIPNPDGQYPDSSADFRGQGMANLATGLFQGMPVGGSMSATALVRTAGAQTALANLVAGAAMATCILALGSTIGYMAMPALAALLILVGFRTLKIHDLTMVWRTGPIQATVLAVTFILTLLIPLQYSVLTGVGLAVILHIARMSNRIVVRRWEFDVDSALPYESSPPQVLSTGELVVLVPYGSLFFAASPIFEQQLPKVPASCEGTVVIIRLRGKDELGVTFIKTLERYAAALETAGGTLMLAGVGAKVYGQLAVTGSLHRIGKSHVFKARRRVGNSLQDAMAGAEAWRLENRR
ncbi:SulP family inorganic anion transporter [Arthrobacter psychrolactophilus]|uniref:SulP family inorganic anion transporter n=1 Tax=Arthrobacter psychrolactophilus TaxID=92442 RepID=A0A2V5IVA9_9MICC|nr:SulP family inorganic anion transporter [Arthrobacter psychrolactophilus]PYI38054.1 SulP family inorganic anion transporter [Arthrobacter psychrolactophilus]